MNTTDADRERSLLVAGRTILHGAGVVGKGLLGIVLIVGLAALLAAGIVFPLWLAATSLTSIYTITVLTVSGALLLAFVIVRIRARTSRITSEEERKAGRRARRRKLGVALSVIGLYAGAAVSARVHPLPGVLVLTASLASMLWLLGRMGGGFRRDSGA